MTKFCSSISANICFPVCVINLDLFACKSWSKSLCIVWAIDEHAPLHVYGLLTAALVAVIQNSNPDLMKLIFVHANTITIIKVLHFKLLGDLGKLLHTQSGFHGCYW